MTCSDTQTKFTLRISTGLIDPGNRDFCTTLSSHEILMRSYNKRLESEARRRFSCGRVSSCFGVSLGHIHRKARHRGTGQLIRKPNLRWYHLRSLLETDGLEASASVDNTAFPRL